MNEFNVRRRAAIDMWGGGGSLIRRRVILVEFVLGFVGGLAIGIWLLLVSTGWIEILLVVWVIGFGLNCLPPAINAIVLSGSGALERELEGVDIRTELHYYAGSQLRVLVPLWVAIVALRQAVSA